MFDCNRLFKILLWLSREDDFFLLAQDAYVICTSIMKQLAGVDVVREEFVLKLETLSSEGLSSGVEASSYQNVIDRLDAIKEHRTYYERKISELKTQAELFWLPAITDMELCGPSHIDRARIWREIKNGNCKHLDECKTHIYQFKHMCVSLMEEHFPHLLEQFFAELEAQARTDTITGDVHTFNFTDVAPMSLLRRMEPTIVTVVTDFPLTHFFLPSKSFARMLGFTQTRLITLPFLEFIVNAAETNFVVDTYRHGRQLPSTVIFYRRADRELASVHWELSDAPPRWHLGAGVDITSEIVTVRTSQGANVQRVLRQWLHSIRNASFQQQAELIEEDVRALQQKLTAGMPVDADIQQILGGLRTLIYTSKASVGLIDQALYSSGLMALTCVADFANALASFPAHFSDTEGLPPVKSEFKILVNRVPANLSDLKNLHVGADMSALQTMVDNIYSNAIRYTDPEKGVRGELRVIECGTNLQFYLAIEDFSRVGLPTSVVKYLQDSLGFQKVRDLRPSLTNRTTPPSPNSLSTNLTNLTRPGKKSSKTGIPHIVEVYNDLTSSGEHDLDILVTVRTTGTSYTLQFAFPLVAPPASLFEETPMATYKDLKDYFLMVENKDKKFLVVDDSSVIRRLIARMFNKLGVPCFCANDGYEALEWFKRNDSICCGLVTDLEMPRMGGEALIHSVLLLQPALPCIVISGNEMVTTNLPDGAMRALTKPISVDALHDVLENMLGLS